MKLRTQPAGTLVLVLGMTTAFAGATPMGPVPQEPVEATADRAAEDPLAAAFVALEDEYDEAYADWRRAYSAASADYRERRATDESAKFEGPDPVEPTFFPRFDRLASAGSAPAKLWCLSYYQSDGPRSDQRRDFVRRVLDVMSRADADLSTLPRILQSKGGDRGLLGDATCQHLMGVLEVAAPTPAIAASAAFASANMLAGSRESDAAKVAAQLVAFRAVAANYPDEKAGQRAAGKVFKQERLQIGMVAPDIVGQDVDGNPMKLSDFRGKVTVIDFWGFW